MLSAFEVLTSAPQAPVSFLGVGPGHIMPDTKLILFPEGKGGRRVDLVLEVGDIVVFRGDCWHAGAKYTPSATFASTLCDVAKTA